MPGFGDFDPRFFVAIIVTFIIAITVHEFMHAWTAWMLGDDTARLLGRVSLNPVVHFDPIGALHVLADRSRTSRNCLGQARSGERLSTPSSRQIRPPREHGSRLVRGTTLERRPWRHCRRHLARWHRPLA